MKIYTNEEMELINNVFDLISAKFGSKEFSDLVKEIKELVNLNQKYAKEIERLKSNEKKKKEKISYN